MRFNAWQRIWFVLAVLIIAALVRYQLHEHLQYETAALRVHLDTLKELQNPVCRPFASDPWSPAWRDLSFDLPCYTLLGTRNFVPNHAPVTEDSLKARRDQDSSESYLTHLQAGLGIGSLLSILVYVFGWVTSKTFKGVAWVFRSERPR